MSKMENYDDIAETYDSTRGATEAYAVKSMMENFTGKTVKEMDMIDIGCGTGNYAEYFLQFEPRSISLMDASEGMLAKAKTKLLSNHPETRLSFKQVVLPDMPYEDNLFDAAMINFVLHHIESNPDGKSFPDGLKALKEVYRILKPGGVLTIMATRPKQFSALWFTPLMPENTQRVVNRLPSHRQHKSCLEEAGFSVKSALIPLIPSHFQGLNDPESIFSESWRKNTAFFGTCTQTEFEKMMQNATQMKNEGTLHEFCETHNKLDTYGIVEILVARKEIK